MAVAAEPDEIRGAQELRGAFHAKIQLRPLFQFPIAFSFIFFVWGTAAGSNFEPRDLQGKRTLVGGFSPFSPSAPDITGTSWVLTNLFFLASGRAPWAVDSLSMWV